MYLQIYITTNLIETKSHGFSDISFFDDKARNDEVRDSSLIAKHNTTYMQIEFEDIFIENIFHASNFF